MQTRKVGCLKNVLFSIVCFYPMLSYGAIAYIPQLLKECIAIVNDVAVPTDSKENIEEISVIIAENRMLTSDIIACDAVQEALGIMKNNVSKFQAEDQRKAVTHYLKKYLQSLENRSALLPMRGDSANMVSWPLSLVSRSLCSGYSNQYSVDFDIMRLNSELVCLESMQLCGFVDFDKKNAGMIQLISDAFKEINQNSAERRDILFNANMMINSGSAYPDISFGTGVSSPCINGWTVCPSFMSQSPINMQFSIPFDFNIRGMRSHKKISLELHFLVTQAQAESGHIRFEVQSKFLKPHHSFAIDTVNPPYTNTDYSKTIMISEPTAPNSIKHMIAYVDITDTHIHANDMAFLSIVRSAPKKRYEYVGNIYLAAAVFKYSS